MDYILQNTSKFSFIIGHVAEQALPVLVQFLVGAYTNKDHQRMMVDPMLLIVQSLWSFLTAVTTTAVAPIAVIFTCIYLNILKLPEFACNYLNLHEFT